MPDQMNRPPITIAAFRGTDQRLFIVGERLFAVLAPIGDAVGDANEGRWFLQTGFGPLEHATGMAFDTLDSALEQMSRMDRALASA
jgi:hypothetical protein